MSNYFNTCSIDVILPNFLLRKIRIKLVISPSKLITGLTATIDI